LTKGAATTLANPALDAATWAEFLAALPKMAN